jgi:hypothetical protein
MSWNTFDRTFAAMILALLLMGALPVQAKDKSVALICDNAAEFVARETNVPLDVLRTISLAETGRTSTTGFHPWPWTVNMEGVGKWFDDFGLALAYVEKHFSGGARSFDVGCFQINYRWHGHAFASIEDMFDPITNARYAARFLTELYQEFGDWTRAAGAYHSRTPRFANKYSARFDRIRANLPEPDVPIEGIVEPDHAPRIVSRGEVENEFPLLQFAGEMSGASLVPLSASTQPFLSGRGAQPLVVHR